MNEQNLDFLDGEPEEKIEFYAAGVGFREAWQENIAALEIGEEVFFVPEPTNKFDEDAVQIVTGLGVFLGYVPAKTGGFKNKWVLNRLSEGQQLIAKVVSVNPGGKPYNALRVRVELLANPLK